MVQKSLQLGVPVGLVYMIIPISGAIMLLIVVERVIDSFQSRRTHE